MVNKLEKAELQAKLAADAAATEIDIENRKRWRAEFESADELLERESPRGQMIYKTHEEQMTSDTRDFSGWDKWVQAHIRLALDKNSEAMAQVMIKNSDALADVMVEYVQEELTKLRLEVQALRTDLTLATAKGTKDDAS